MNTARILERPVLTLNRHWSAIQTTSVKEAIALVSKGSARIIDPETFEVHDIGSWADVSKLKAKFGDAMVRSPSISLIAPEVIVLTGYEGLGERSVVFSRRNIFKRDRYTCQYCGRQPGPDSLTIDHVHPKSKGGKSSWENCTLACLECNKRKADKSPEQAKMVLRKTPKKPSWKMLAQVSPKERRESWDQFLSRVYWETELEA